MEKLNFTLVENIVSQILEGLPKFLGAIGLLILLYVIAKIVRKVVRIFLEKMKVDKLAEKFEEIDIISKNNIKIVPSAIIAGAIYYMIIMLSVVAITDMLHLTTISNYLTGLITYLPKVFTAFAFLIVGFLFSEFIRKGIYTAGKSVLFSIHSNGIFRNCTTGIFRSPFRPEESLTQKKFIKFLIHMPKIYGRRYTSPMPLLKATILRNTHHSATMIY